MKNNQQHNTNPYQTPMADVKDLALETPIKLGGGLLGVRLWLFLNLGLFLLTTVFLYIDFNSSGIIEIPLTTWVILGLTGTGLVLWLLQTRRSLFKSILPVYSTLLPFYVILPVCLPIIWEQGLEDFLFMVKGNDRFYIAITCTFLYGGIGLLFSLYVLKSARGRQTFVR